MHNTREINDDIYYLGASDRRIELFENVYGNCIVIDT